MATTEPKDIREIQKLRRSAEHRYAWRLSEKEHAAKVRAGLSLRLWGELAGGGAVQGSAGAQAGAGEGRFDPGFEGAATRPARSRGVDGLLIALKAVESWGAGFGPEDIARLEREFVEAGTGAGPEDSLWINQGVDALLRGDVWGYLAPGKPSVAAELAWRHLSPFHEGSRLYAGMFAAACVSVAFVADDLLEAVYVGLGEVPDESRISRAVAAALRIHRTSAGWSEAKERLGAEAAASDWDRPAVAIAQGVLALLFGEADPRRTWELLGEAGFDDPSLNGVTGSITGVQTGVAGTQVKPLSRRDEALVGEPGSVDLGEVVARAVLAAVKVPHRTRICES